MRPTGIRSPLSCSASCRRTSLGESRIGEVIERRTTFYFSIALTSRRAEFAAAQSEETLRCEHRDDRA